MTAGPRPICADCIHAEPDLSVCTAFPDGIPKEIENMVRDHRRPYAGDEGITFQPREGSELTGDPSQPIPWLIVQPEGGD